MAVMMMRSFRFRVALHLSPEAPEGAPAPPGGGASTPGAAFGDGAFQEVSGLELSMDVAEYLEGGRNDGAIRRAGRARHAPIILKRGMFYGAGAPPTVNRDLWAWIQDCFAGVRPIRRYDGAIEVLARGQDEVVATWTFDRGLPLRLRGPELNARTGEIAIEELHIAHEGLRLV
ncbi:phage tail protein [Caulobacter sp. BE254]|jgi:phage tail-like protein|uniref:phage tail protein n=1 Tax=Caulobacter sp. BE254 TaxID=2817720 RepID=UPI00285F1F90|nr:phage tail protein [Caulobacter sp. BE254]MDR7115587.1 phage tail-like protein [Caulobacter sp. BE254]